MHDKIERYIRNMRAYYEKLGASPDFIDQLELQWRRLDPSPAALKASIDAIYDRHMDFKERFDRLKSEPLICPHCSEDIDDEGDHGSCNQHAREEARDAIDKARDE